MSTTPPLALTVIVLFDDSDSLELLERTVQAILGQEGRGERFVTPCVHVWCNGTNASVLKRERSNIAPNVVVLSSAVTFLRDLPETLKLLEDKNIEGLLVFLRCGVVLKPQCLAILVEEMDDSVVVTARGFRLFPHRKLLSSPITQLERRVHYEFYSESNTSREVHVFTTDFCCLSVDVLRRIISESGSNETLNTTGFTHIWCSYVITSRLGLPIWKNRMDKYLDMSFISSFTALVDLNTCNTASFEEFYSLAYNSNWPKGASVVNYGQEKLDAGLKSCETREEIWSRGFAGVNMLSEPASSLDMEAVVSCGVRVVRIGAVGGAQDLLYLLDPSSTTETQDKTHLLKMLPRLRRSITELGRHGIKAIITMVDLPGSKFFSLPDDAPMLFWENRELHLRAIKFWGLMAQNLLDLNHLIMGYDPINEPFFPEERELSFIDKTPTSHVEALNDFYRETVEEIRKYDKETIIIINPSRWAFPIAMATLRPLPDPNIRYGVHCYYPPPLTLQRDTELKYPGLVTTFPRANWSEGVLIDRAYLRKLFLDHVVSWQNKYNVPPGKILMTEFGIIREVPGAQEYLQDLVEIFAEFGWSWLVFSFRDEEWDALDYELGVSKSNMLYRSNCNLFQSIAKHFK